MRNPPKILYITLWNRDHFRHYNLIKDVPQLDFDWVNNAYQISNRKVLASYQFVKYIYSLLVNLTIINYNSPFPLITTIGFIVTIQIRDGLGELLMYVHLKQTDARHYACLGSYEMLKLINNSTFLYFVKNLKCSKLLFVMGSKNLLGNLNQLSFLVPTKHIHFVHLKEYHV